MTDSAAGATAFATGVRTYNGAVSVDVDGNPVTTLLEHAKDLRKATGLVTTAQVTDATPAAFGSHVPDRGDQSEIARQFIEVTKPDVILGGGEDWWYPVGDPGAYPDDPADRGPRRARAPSATSSQRAEGVGYDYVEHARGARRDPVGPGPRAVRQRGDVRAGPEGQGDEYAPVVPLTTMTAKALDILSRDRHGFFLVVEEEAIDEMAHNNNAARTIQAGQALDATVALVREYVAKHRDTLVVVVGDHETGGLAIENVDREDESGDPASTDPGVVQSLEDGPFPIANSDLEFTVDWTTGGHTGAATPLTAEGPRAERLARAQDNTDVFTVVLEAMRDGADGATRRGRPSRRPRPRHSSPASRYSTSEPATATFRLAPVPTIGISTTCVEQAERLGRDAGLLVAEHHTVRRRAAGRSPSRIASSASSTPTIAEPRARWVEPPDPVAGPVHAGGRRSVLPRSSASGTHGRRGTARHAPTASHVRRRVPRLTPCSGHRGATTRWSQQPWARPRRSWRRSLRVRTRTCGPLMDG